MKYYILDERVPVGVPDPLEWAKFFEEADRRRVAVTELPGAVRVSTVFLGLDHNWSLEGPPILFETMIFGGPHDEYQERYATWGEAEAGHARAVSLASDPALKPTTPKGTP